MKYKKHTCLLLFLIVLFASCDNFISTRIEKNDKEDIEKALKYTIEFYDLVGAKNYDSLFAYFNVAGKDTSLRENYNLVESIKGDLLKIKTEIAASERVNRNGQTTVKYQIDIICDYEKGKTKEFLELKEIDDKIFFIGHNIDLSHFARD